MRTLAVLFIAMAVALLPGTAEAVQARAKTIPYRVEGKIVEVSKGWIQVEVTRVLRGSGIKVGEKLKITESAQTRVLQAGKQVARSRLAAGETVEVSGQMVSGKSPTFRATTLAILK
jgi:hypothetical protein